MSCWCRCELVLNKAGLIPDFGVGRSLITFAFLMELAKLNNFARYMNIVWTVALLTIGLNACRKSSWNPDKQFTEQKRVQEVDARKAQIETSQNISKKVLRFERDAFVRIQSGTSISELNKIMGYRFEVLASIPDAASVWETRRYRVGHLIASHFGQTSKEFEICDKDRELFTLTLANGVVRTVEY